MTSTDADFYIAEFMQTLIEVATRKGDISPAQTRIIDAVADMMTGVFRRALINAYNNGFRPEDIIHLEKIKDLVVETAQLVAEEDGKTTKEEMTLIVAILVGLKIPIPL